MVLRFTLMVLPFGCLFGYTLSCDFSRVRHFIGAARKSDFLMALQRFIQLFARKAGHTVHTIVINCIQTDGAGELADGATRRWCEANQIAIQLRIITGRPTGKWDCRKREKNSLLF